MEKVILFGLSHAAKSLFSIYDSAKDNGLNIQNWILAIADNDKTLWGSSFKDKRIIAPVEIANYHFDKIIICLKGVRGENIKNQLLKQNIPHNKIAYLYEYMTLPQEKIENCKLLVDRRNAFRFFQKNGVVVEVGVAFGNLTTYILKEMSPKKFYAIDYFFKNNPYLTGMGGMWQNERFRASKLTLKEFYERKFAEKIKQGILEVKQGLSWEVLGDFEDDTFDFIYLDAAHDYESVSKDIEVIKRKVKNGGIIQFNDYGFVHAATKQAYGVSLAVNKFVWSEHVEVLFYCLNTNGLDDLAVRIYKP